MSPGARFGSHPFAQDGSPMRELVQVLPALSRGQVKALVSELAAEQKVHVRGKTRAARWHFGAEASQR